MHSNMSNINHEYKLTIGTGPLKQGDVPIFSNMEEQAAPQFMPEDYIHMVTFPKKDFFVS